MKALFIILTVLVILASILLTIVVLLQNSKGGGLASNFTTGNQTFGVRQTADMLEKITWGLVAFIFVVSVITTFIPHINQSGNITDQINTEVTAPAPDFNGEPADTTNAQ